MKFRKKYKLSDIFTANINVGTKTNYVTRGCHVRLQAKILWFWITIKRIYLTLRIDNTFKITAGNPCDGTVNFYSKVNK